MSEYIQSIEFTVVGKGPATRIQVRLAADVPACCGVSDGAYMEFHQEGHYKRADLELREDPAGHILEGNAEFASPGAYGYRLVAKILGTQIFREGTYLVPETER